MTKILLFATIFVAIISFVFYYKNNNNTLEKIIQTLYRQCSRWAVAAEQDSNDIIRVLHANYAAGYLWAIKDIAPTNVFARATGEQFHNYEKKIVRIQDDATMKLATSCKNVIPTSEKMLLDAIYGKHTTNL